MQYTDNYQFREPTPAVDIVKVGDINYNSRKIDELIHSTQVSLAPAYDETRTSADPYNTGDVVMKDALMYKCKEDGIYGAWDATKWERTTAGEEGAGGSEVEANPQGTPTDDLEKIGINGTIYNIAGSGGGGGNVYGAFIDTNRVIQAEKSVGSSDTYTATQDCMVVILLPIGNHNTYVYIDGVKVINMSGMANTYYDYTTIPLKEGQVMTFDFGSTSGYITVYGLTFGTNNIFTPQIYSTEEREVGVWIDNKPLYQKTVELTNQLTVSNNSWTSIGILANTLDIETYVNCNAINSVGVVWNDVDAGTFNGYICLCTGRNGDTITAKYVNLWYTKTTDTAGSGSYNTLGVPMVHYSETEQVIGTDEDGKTIYERTFKVTSPTWSHGSGFSTIAVDISSIGTVDKLNFVRGTVYDNTDDRMFNIPYFRVENSESLLYECRVNSDGTPYFVLFVRHSTGAGYSLSNLSVTLQYKKSSS